MRAGVLFVALAMVCSGDTLSKGWEHFYNLEYGEALREFEAEVAANPGDPNLHNHVAQTILYREMYNAGALESELVSGSNPFLRREGVATSAGAAKAFANSIQTAMNLSQERIEKNDKDVGALYALGVAHGLRANYNFLVRKAWMDSLKDATAGRKLHNRVVELKPEMIDARLMQGVHDYVVGSLPWHWKMLGFVAGFRGDREEGLRTLRLVAQKGNLNAWDAQVLLAAIYRRERRPLEALPLLERLVARFQRNYLFRLEMVQMYSDAGKKDEALDVLARVESLKRSGAAGYGRVPLEKIFYYRGNLLFWYRDFEQAIEQLRRVTPRASTLDLHTAVMAWLRLGQSLDMAGRRQEAVAAYKQAMVVAPESDAAKEARGYLGSAYRRKG